MMDPDEARIVLRWVRHYATLGRIAPPHLKAIEADCLKAMESGSPTQMRAKEGMGLSQVVHVLGGALLAAAAIAAVLLLFPDRFANAGRYQAWTLALMGLGGAGVGFGLLYTTRNRDLADAFLVAGLSCLAMMAMPDEGQAKWLAPLGMIASIAIPAVRRGSIVAAFASLAFAMAAFRTFQTNFPDASGFFSVITDTGLTFWLVAAMAHLAAIAVALRIFQQGWLSEALGVEAVTLVLPLAWFLGEVADPGGHNVFFERYGGVEILVAAVEAGLLGLAMAWRQGTLLATSALVISVDAIIFAFDVGGLEFGVVSLLVVAGAVLWLGSFLRKRWGRGGAPPPSRATPPKVS